MDVEKACVLNEPVFAGAHSFRVSIHVQEKEELEEKRKKRIYHKRWIRLYELIFLVKSAFVCFIISFLSPRAPVKNKIFVSDN